MLGGVLDQFCFSGGVMLAAIMCMGCSDRGLHQSQSRDGCCSLAAHLLVVLCDVVGAQPEGEGDAEQATATGYGSRHPGTLVLRPGQLARGALVQDKEQVCGVRSAAKRWVGERGPGMWGKSRPEFSSGGQCGSVHTLTRPENAPDEARLAMPWLI